LTEEEQNKLREKYKSQWSDLGPGLDNLWAGNNERKKKEENKKNPKNDPDSLLAELKEANPFLPNNDALDVVKRITANVPTSSPRRSEFFQALRKAADSHRFEQAYATACLRAAIRYADRDDVPELVTMFQEADNAGQVTILDLLADRLAE